MLENGSFDNRAFTLIVIGFHPEIVERNDLKRETEEIKIKHRQTSAGYFLRKKNVFSLIILRFLFLLSLLEKNSITKLIYQINKRNRRKRNGNKDDDDIVVVVDGNQSTKRIDSRQWQGNFLFILQIRMDSINNITLC